VNLPSDDAAERYIAGALLLGMNADGHRAVDMLGDLETDDLLNERCQHVLRVSRNHADEGKPSDAVIVAETLEREGNIHPAWNSAVECAADLMVMMSDTPPVWHVQEWSRRVLDKSRLRRLMTGVKALEKDIANPTFEPEDIANEFERMAKIARTGKSKRESTSMVLTCGTDIRTEELDWFWRNRFLKKAVNQIQGDPGDGKSFLTAFLGAANSIGADWPDGESGGKPGNTIFFSAEDDPATTTAPRLEKAGADMSRIFFFETMKVHDPKTGKMIHKPFNMGEHVPQLEKAITDIGGVTLVVIDPVSAYGGKTDQHKNGDVRGMLMPLADLAMRFGIAIINVTHMSKSPGGKAIYRGTGSLAYTAAARIAWLLGRDPQEPKRRLLLPVKCNVGPEVGGLAFSIIADHTGRPFLRWEENAVDMTGDSFLEMELQHQLAKGKEGDEGEVARAAEFIKKQLANGPMLSNDLAAAVKANDISVSSFKRAKAQLGIRADKQKMTTKWWTLMPDQKLPEPEVKKEEAQKPVRENVEPLGNVGNVLFRTDEEEAQGSQEAQEVQRMGSGNVSYENRHLKPSGRRKASKKKPATTRKSGA
jgi:hypothetical protein